jgi:hypothetical protein
VGLNLLSTFVLTPVLLTVFQRRIPILFPKTLSRSLPYTQTVLVTLGPPQRASMAWYSDEALEAFAIVVWSLAFVLFLVALALPCPLCLRDVRDWTTCWNKCVASLLGLGFVSHLVTSDEGTLQPCTCKTTHDKHFFVVRHTIKRTTNISASLKFL